MYVVNVWVRLCGAHENVAAGDEFAANRKKKCLPCLEIILIRLPHPHRAFISRGFFYQINSILYQEEEKKVYAVNEKVCRFRYLYRTPSIN